MLNAPVRSLRRLASSSLSSFLLPRDAATSKSLSNAPTPSLFTNEYRFPLTTAATAAPPEALIATSPALRIENCNTESPLQNRSSLAAFLLKKDRFRRHGVAGKLRSRHQAVQRQALHTETDAYVATELAMDSVVKIFTVSSSPNYFLPWQNKSQRETMGSGFVIPGKRILTNAHVVADQTFVLVRKHGSPNKYRAEVLAVGHECDLAMLVVESEEFWEGMNFLELGDVPFLQEAVAVVGYPQGDYVTVELIFIVFASSSFFILNSRNEEKTKKGLQASKLQTGVWVRDPYLVWVPRTQIGGWVCDPDWFGKLRRLAGRVRFGPVAAPGDSWKEEKMEDEGGGKGKTSI